MGYTGALHMLGIRGGYRKGIRIAQVNKRDLVIAKRELLLVGGYRKGIRIAQVGKSGSKDWCSKE